MFEHQKQKDQVARLLTQIESNLDNVFSNLCYQVKEEDISIQSPDQPVSNWK